MKKFLAFILSATMGLSALNITGVKPAEVKANENTEEVSHGHSEQEPAEKTSSLDSSLKINKVNEDQSESELSSVEITDDEKVTLRTNAVGDLKWQIHVGGDTWVGIAESNSQELIVSRALIENLMDANKSVKIRVFVSGEDHDSFSNSITVSLIEKVEEPKEEEPEIKPEIEQEMIVEGPIIVTPEEKENANTPETPDVPEEVIPDTPTVGDPVETPETPVEEEQQPSVDVQETPEVNQAEEAIETPQSDPLENDGVNFLKKKIYRLNEQENPADGTNQPEDVELVSIIVKFQFTDGTEVAAPWTATVEKGSKFQATVTAPVISGYKPDKDSLTINKDAIDKDIEEVITYSPSDINFQLNVYLQNVENDDYSLSAEYSKELTGVTKDPVKNYLVGVLPNLEGFIQLPYDAEVKIAHDGSTVIEVYYDRLYYLVLFDLDGGFGTEPVYAKYGTTIKAENPEKPGYTFNGWVDNNGNSFNPTIQAANLVYKAQWIKKQTANLTIVVWGQNPDRYSEIPDSVTDGSEIENYRIPDNTYSWLGEKVLENQKVSQNGETVNLDSLIDSKELQCSTEEHTHTKDCYSLFLLTCGKEEHKHNVQCIIDDLTNDKDSNKKWIYNSELSVPVTVLPDGTSVLNIYLDRVTYQMTFQSQAYDATEYLTLNEKWGTQIFPAFKWVTDKKLNKNEKQYGWNVGLNGESGSITYINVMPLANKKYYPEDYKSVTINQPATWFTEKIDSTDPKLDSNYEVYWTVPGIGGYVNEQEKISIEGFTYDRGTNAGSPFNNSKFYYTRNKHDLVFGNIDGDSGQTSKTETVKFGEQLSKYLINDPQPPKGLYEEGSVKFAGWYKNKQCTDGAEIDLSNMTMPDNNVAVYAKWVPVKRTVTFRTEKNSTDSLGEYEVLHREVLDENKLADSIKVPVNDPLTFIGWFYEEDGVEKAFHTSMPVTKDLNLYGKWSSDELVPWTIRYVYDDPEKGRVDIADPETVNGLHGITKTIDAKTGINLYADYRKGYYPDVSNHSITFDINKKNQVFEFVYTPKETLTYSVKYIEKGTGGELAPTKTSDPTADAIVTEKFLFIENYMPDAYSKRLIMSSNEQNNVITFYYSKDNVHAPVSIIYMQQNIDGDGYTAVEQKDFLEYTINSTVEAEVKSYTGFKFKEAKAYHGTSDEKPDDLEKVDGKVSAVLTNKGLQIILYYDRDLSSYTVNYLESGTDKVLEEAKTVDKVRFGKTITETAISIPGYEPSKNVESITIKTEANQNVINFYYAEKDIEIKYEIIAPEGVATTDVGTLTRSSENIKAISGIAHGSIAAANTGYKFVGWYEDPDCIKSIGNELHYTPDKSIKDENGLSYPNGEQGYKPATYYAKFERNTGKLIINKTIADGKTSGNQVFQFSIQNAEANIDVVVGVETVNGSGSITVADLPIVDTPYTIREILDWYGDDYSVAEQSKTVTVVEGQQIPVTFTNTKNPQSWFKDSDAKRNTFTGKAGN